MAQPPTRTVLAPAALLAVSLAGGAPPSTTPPEAEPGMLDAAVRGADAPRVVTLLDYFESGRREVDSFVRGPVGAATRPPLEGLIARLETVCVRVELLFGQQGSAYRSVIGSGVLIDGGRGVLTAGHNFDGVAQPRVRVILPTGEARDARLTDRQYDQRDGGEDWALLELAGPAAPVSWHVRRAEARVGGLAIVLGYPDRIGIDAAGRVAHASPGDGRYREPLTTLAEVERQHPLVLSPRAGAIPTGGMSGGPVFDERGRLLGVFSSVSRIETAGEVRYAYNASPAAAIGPAAGLR